MRKSCPGSYVILDPWVHLASSLGVYALLLLGSAVVRLCRVQPIRSQRVFHWFIAALTPVAAVTFLVRIHTKDMDIRACSFWSASHVFTLLVDSMFFLRFLVEILEGHVPELVPSMTDCWLLVNTVWKMVKIVVVDEYHFLVLIRFFYPQTLEMYTRLLTRLIGIKRKDTLFHLGIITIWVFVYAGALHTTEEWSQLLGIHPDAEGQVTAWHSYWDYIYMGYITVSTVGYGDMTPSTIASQVLVVVIIVGYIAWYADSCQSLYQALEGTFLDIVGYLPPVPLHRRLVVVGRLDKDKMQQLLDELCVQEETQVIVGVNREECLSLRKVSGVFVIRSDLDSTFFESCFPKYSEEAPSGRPSYTLMILNQEGDGDQGGARESDSYVLSLVQMVKAKMPDLPILAQVWLTETSIAVQNMEGWSTPTDQIVCYEELMAGLTTQNVAAEGAASILATLITTPPTTVPPVTHTCADKMTNAHLRAQSLILHISNRESKEESFQQAAIQYYLDGVLLLGYVHHKAETARQDRCHILPTFIPPQARRVLLVPADLVFKNSTVDAPTTHHSEKMQLSPLESHSPHIRLEDKTVWVIEDGPAGGVTQGALQRNLRLLSGEPDAHIDVASLLAPLDEPSKALYTYYCAKAYLADVSSLAPLVANVEHGMQPGVGKVSAGCPHACTSYINPSIVTSAVCLAYRSELCFRLWKFFVQGCHVVEVKVNYHHSYGQMFQYLLTRRKMLAVGATVLVNCRSCAACTKVLHLDLDQGNKLAITNPDFNLPLHPGDKVVAFSLEDEAYSV